MSGVIIFLSKNLLIFSFVLSSLEVALFLISIVFFLITSEVHFVYSVENLSYIVQSFVLENAEKHVV